MKTPQRSGLPPRIYAPIVAVAGIIFLAIMVYLLRIGFGVNGSLFGSGTGSPPPQAAATPASQAVSVEGGPPPAVADDIAQLRKRIARDPHDDVAITQLGDMFLAAGKYAQAIPLYRRALAVNPHNAAAQEGLSQAQAGLKAEQ